MVLTEISFLDAFLSFIYAFVILIIGFSIKNSLKHQEWNKFFLPFIFFKLLFAIFFVFIHIYVYKGGDTFLFFGGARFISQQITENPFSAFRLLTGSFEDFKLLSYTEDFAVIFAFKDPTTLATSQLVSIFCLLGFNQFMTTTILLSTASSIGIWGIYKTLCKAYPSLYKTFALCVLFYPTLGIWGSGILKDTITLATIGFIFTRTYNLVQRKNIVSSSLIIVASVIICLKLKPYILYTFIPAMLLWVQSRISGGIKNSFIKTIAKPIIILVFIGGGYFFLQTISQEAGKYSLDNVESVAKDFQSWHTYLAETRNQSGYSLGEVEFTPLGLLSKVPSALFVTFYRPFPTEVRNFALALESVESTILLFLTLFIIFKLGLIRFIRIFFSNNDVRAFMLFAIILGIAVGVTSYNFGALSRYKIPCIPFFTSSLAIIYYIGIRQKRNGMSRKHN